MSQKTMIEVSDVTMRFRLNNDKILSLTEAVQQQLLTFKMISTKAFLSI